MVVESRIVDNMMRRRRECQFCGHRFSTYEVDDGLLKTIKKHWAPHQAAIAKRVALTRRNEKIIARLKAGDKHAVIAEEFGLSDNMVSTIASRNGISSQRSRKSNAVKEETIAKSKRPVAVRSGRPKNSRKDAP